MLACKQDEASTEPPPDLVPESPTLALTPTEYNNTVRDLLRMDLDGSGWPSPSSVGSSASSAWPWELPAEPGIGGFEGIAAGQAPSTSRSSASRRAAFAAYAAASRFYRCGQSSLSLEEQESCGWESLSRFAPEERSDAHDGC